MRIEIGELPRKIPYQNRFTSEAAFGLDDEVFLLLLKPDVPTCFSASSQGAIPSPAGRVPRTEAPHVCPGRELENCLVG